jgi:hypothetical protein
MGCPVLTWLHFAHLNSREKKKDFLFFMQEIGAKTQNGGLVSVVLHFLGMGEYKSSEV